MKSEERGLLADRHLALYEVIDAAGASHGKPMQAYLMMTATRLSEMHRVLKPPP